MVIIYDFKFMISNFNFFQKIAQIYDKYLEIPKKSCIFARII